ncbi:nuclear transport factor 2 family protein [Striga asiatica]|uniref:Nuclear transport factor 2 family protein n=1 Tax=Striga asiatica TaxID=4170 RepID=A0A5A7QM01_STRAF|nr:nuclear transport factor 2 family protein [Striga asiatica]
MRRQLRVPCWAMCPLAPLHVFLLAARDSAHSSDSETRVSRKRDRSGYQRGGHFFEDDDEPMGRGDFRRRHLGFREEDDWWWADGDQRRRDGPGFGPYGQRRRDGLQQREWPEFAQADQHLRGWYISTGKYTTMGQKLMASATPTT